MSTRPQGDDLRNRVLWLITFRVAIVTLLMGATASIHLKEGGELLAYPIIPIYILVGLSYLVTILSLFAFKLIKKTERFANSQIAVDILLATALVYATGGIDSIFSFLYLFIIMWAGIVLYGRGVFLTASLSAILYGALLDLQYYGYLPRLEVLLNQSQSYSGSQVLYKIFINITAFYTIAFLSSYMFRQLRKTGEMLKEKEIDYEALEALNKKIVQEIDSGIMTIDQYGFITSFNKAAEDITGFALRDAYRSKVDMIFPGFTDRVAEYNKGLKYHRGAGKWGTAHTNKNGNLLYLVFSISSLKGIDGKEVGSIIIFQDLTSYKEMEDAVRRAEKLSAIGKLAAGMAHEIRNPLASMSGSIQVLRNEVELNGENMRLMDIILRESERLNRLVTEFLDYAKPYKPQKEEFDLSRVMAETLDVFEKGLSANRRIRIQKEITPEIKVYGEQEKIKDVLWNLFNNAAQSMPTGGELAVSLKNDAGMAVSAIKDTGEGIAERDIERVFEPFFTTKTYGTGLGLATVYRVVEAHGGDIRVESETGKGATFTVRIPLREAGSQKS